MKTLYWKVYKVIGLAFIVVKMTPWVWRLIHIWGLRDMELVEQELSVHYPLEHKRMIVDIQKLKAKCGLHVGTE